MGSVRFELSGPTSHSHTENLAPYSLYGDSDNSAGVKELHGQALPAGSYTLTTTAYTQRSLGGDTLGTISVTFVVAQADRSVGPTAGWTSRRSLGGDSLGTVLVTFDVAQAGR